MRNGDYRAAEMSSYTVCAWMDGWLGKPLLLFTTKEINKKMMLTKTTSMTGHVHLLPSKLGTSWATRIDFQV